MQGFVVRAGWVLSGWFLCAACAVPPKTPAAPPQRTATASSVPSGIGNVTYRLTPMTPSVALDDRGTRGVLLDDRRFTITKDGQVVLAEMQATGLMPAVVMPARWGGGFLFWNGDAVYRARTFTGALEAIAPLPTNAVGFDFGPDTLLVIAENSRRRQYTLGGKPVPLSPPNLIDFVASDDGRALAIDAAGRLLASTDTGRTWKAVPRNFSAPITALQSTKDEVWAALGTDRKASLGAAGQLLEGPSPPAVSAPRARAAHSSDTDWSQAASNGIELDAGQALTVSGNQFSVVTLASGKVTEGPQRIAEPGTRCETLSAGARWLFVCANESGTVSVLSGPAHQTPVVEKSFPGKPTFWFSEGALLIGAPCGGDSAAGHVCVRTADAHYAEYDFSAALTRSGIAEPRVFQWVPRAKGPPVALLAHATEDGSARGWSRIALSPAAVVALDAPLPRPFVERQYRASSEAASHDYRKQVNTHWTLLADGSLRGISSEGSLRIAANGHVEVDAHRFSALGQHAGRAFAQTADHHFFQTLDFGEHWQEVLGPVTDSGQSFSYDCSQIGCFLGPWSRLGWPAEPPRAPARALPVPTPISEAPAPTLPSLRCEPQGNASAKWTPGSEAEASTYRDHETGPGAIDEVFDAVRATLDKAPRDPREHAGRAPAPMAVGLSFSEPFDASGASRRASVSSGAWRAAWQKQEDLLPTHGGSRPILSPNPGHASGVLLNDEDRFAFTVGLDGKLRALPKAGECEYCSGFLDAKGALWLALSKSSGATPVFAADTAKVLFRLPAIYLSQRGEADEPARAFLPPGLGLANSDALAVGPKGTLAVLRLPSGAEPAGGDSPALLLGAAGEVSELAAWSTIELASSPECTRDTTGYRALIQTPWPWLAIEGAATPAGGMSAIVRWSNARVCLEALEMPLAFAALHQSQPGQPNPKLVARFVGASPGAAALLKTATLDYRQALRCSLLPATRN